MTAVSNQRINASCPSEPGVAMMHGRRPDAGVSLTVLAAALVAARPLSNLDVRWHARTGELILDEGLVSTDPWSFMSTEPWQFHEWLSEVAMYAAHVAARYAEVVALVNVTTACFAGVLAVSCRPIPAAAVLLRDTPLVEGLELIGWRVDHEKDGLVVLLPPTARPER